jgi:quercetin dioxygenase-like cupin family protein
MRTSRVAGLLFLATATLAQQQQPVVEITSEPSHHLVLENEYVRVFDVTVAPKATTMIHRHNHDYLFVTLGDTDIVNARVGENPVELVLKDGEVRFTPGNFAHAAANKSDQPFHNITIELLKPSTAVKSCTSGCDEPSCSGDAAAGNPSCPITSRRIDADQWKVSMITLPAGTKLADHAYAGPHLIVAVSPLELKSEIGTLSTNIKRDVGGLIWAPTGTAETLTNSSAKEARMIILEFEPVKP